MEDFRAFESKTLINSIWQEALNSPKHSALLSEALRHLWFTRGCTCRLQKPFLSSQNSIQLLKRHSLLWHCFFAWKNNLDKHFEGSFCTRARTALLQLHLERSGGAGSRCCASEELSGSSLLPPLLPGTQAPWSWRAGSEEEIAKIRLDWINPLSSCSRAPWPVLFPGRSVSQLCSLRSRRELSSTLVHSC